MSLRRWQKALLLFLFYYAFLYIGAAIIMYIEANELSEDEAEITTPAQQLQDILARDHNITMNETSANKILEVSHKLFVKSEKRKKGRWKRKISSSTLIRWRYFTHITISTVGYGDIVPETNGGRIFVILYAMIGIPVNLIFITRIGYMLADCCRWVIRKFEKRMLKVTNVKNIEHKNLLMLTLICVSWLSVGAKFGRYSMGWSWTESYYAAFVKYTTIGYGDYILRSKSLKNLAEVISWYTIVGLAIVTGIFDTITTIFNNTVGMISSKVSIDEQNSTEMHETTT